MVDPQEPVALSPAAAGIRGALFLLFALGDLLVVRGLVVGWGRPVATFLIRAGLVGGVGKAVALYLIALIYFFLLGLSVFLAYLGTGLRPWQWAVKFWLFMVAVSTCLLGWWLAWGAIWSWAKPFVPEGASVFIESGLFFLGLMLIAVAATRIGPRFGVGRERARRKAA